MKKFRAYYVLLLVFIVLYFVEILLIPPNAAAVTRYGISETTAKLLTFSFALPLIAIWYAAFMGFIRVKQYASLAGDTKDGRALRILGNGLMALAISLPLTTILGSGRTYLGGQHPDWIPELAITYNYITLAMSLGALWLIAHGSKRMVKLLKKQPYTLTQIVLTVFFTLFCVAYTYVSLRDSSRGALNGVSASAPYYLPDFLVFSTIVVPYICLWYLGFRAAYHIRLYSRQTPGVLYKQALNRMALGIAFVALSLMVLRLLTSLSSILNSLSLRYLLALIYALVITIGVGYVLIAVGAKKLKKIEEV